MRLTGFALIITAVDAFAWRKSHEFKWRRKKLQMSVKSYQSTAREESLSIFPPHRKSSARIESRFKRSQSVIATTFLQFFYLRKVQQERFFYFFVSAFTRVKRKIWQERRRNEKIYRNHHLAHTHDKNTSSAR